MNLVDWLQKIEGLHPVAWDLGLDRIRQVADQLGVLEPFPKQFLVAGTNGKGSVVHAIEFLCSQQGLTTGLSTSPHLHRFNERIRINGHSAADGDIVKAFELIEAARGEVSLTYFEFAALASLVLFKEAEVDCCILEVGLGGRLDAMNIITPDVAVVTRVAMDHEQWLGNDLETIGAEKAAIFRPGRPAVIGQRDAPESVLSATSDEDRYQLGNGFFVTENSLNVTLSNGSQQQYVDLPVPVLHADNLSCAVQAMVCVGLTPKQNAVTDLFASLRMPGRRQVLESGGIQYVLDVAHNPDAAALLAMNLREMKTSKNKVAAVVAMYEDKDLAGVFKPLLDVVDSWYFCGMGEARGAEPSRLEEVLRQSVIDPGRLLSRSYGKVSEAMSVAAAEAGNGDQIVIFGSFPAVAAGLETLGASHR